MNGFRQELHTAKCIGLLSAELQPPRPLIIRKEVFSIKYYHITIGNTRKARKEKEIACGFQLHFIRLKGQGLQLIQ